MRELVVMVMVAVALAGQFAAVRETLTQRVQTVSIQPAIEGQQDGAIVIPPLRADEWRATPRGAQPGPGWAVVYVERGGLWYAECLASCEWMLDHTTAQALNRGYATQAEAWQMVLGVLRSAGLHE
jgi:hypothetical protein